MTAGIIALYFLILLVVSTLSYRKGFRNIFTTGTKLPWILAGFSVFVINPDTINILSKMGIVAGEGYAGMWTFYTGVLGAGFLPILFAPLWSRLKFMTDNQFILFRFSGMPARVLHLFRAVYVGYLVVALFIAQVFIGLSKLLVVFFDLSYSRSFLAIAGILVLLIAKNSLRLKVRSDFLNGMIYILAFAIGAFFVIRHSGGIHQLYPKLNTEYSDYTRLFPESLSGTSLGSLPTVLVYFFIQWWSIHVLDGAGPEAQRFMNTGSSFQAFKAAFLPLILFSLVFLFHSFVIDAGIIMVNETAYQVPLVNGQADVEASFIMMYRNAMPEGLSALVFLAFFVGFMSFLESFINWGSGFIVVDVFRTYVFGGNLFGGKTDRFYSLLSYLTMLVIGSTGILIAWYNTHLLGLQKFIFAMGAGVGPVFILRWFWWRINAWSQFTAMITSLVYAIGWDLLYDAGDPFSLLVDHQLEAWNLSYYAFKLVCLTVLVTASWLLVTFLTRPDDRETLDQFVKTVQPGGIWPLKVPGRKRINPQRILLLVIYPVISILPFLMIWQFKFGSLLAGLMMSLAWVALMTFTVKKMAALEIKE